MITIDLELTARIYISDEFSSYILIETINQGTIVLDFCLYFENTVT